MRPFAVLEALLEAAARTRRRAARARHATDLWSLVLAHEERQHAFAQAAIGDADARRGKGQADFFKDRAARQHEIGTLAPDTGILGAGGIVHGEQPRGDIADRGTVEPAAVDARAVIALEAELNAGNRRDRAGGAEQMIGHGVAAGRRPSPAPRNR